MSTTLYWQPVPNLPPLRSLPCGLKGFLAKRYLDHGSLKGSFTIRRGSLGALNYLEGLADAGIDGAAELIGAIAKSDVLLTIE